MELLIFSRQNWVLGVTLTLTDHNVKNIVGSSGRVRRSQTWKRFWEMKTGEKFPDECQRYQCTRRAVLGAHVFVECIYEGNLIYRENFILPSCTDCNQKDQKNSEPTWDRVKSGAKVAWTTSF